MTCFVSHTTFSCTDAYALSEWWKRLLDYTDIPGDPNKPGHDHCMIVDPVTGHRLLFLEVDEVDASRTPRAHLDLRPRTGGRDAEVERVRALGAVEVADHRGIHGPGSGWVVFADPQGNQFCVLRSEEEVAAR
ncbi:VOC family protein [Nesterenkonia sp. CL21]|uniref:VOC family protein n=1 Tax=Nesterenkonia sp. CL21 TaxID=3064894 RepID=UPI00287A5BC6|nr:VOC family protein [Nesterenkonia sp. CL21]MDS2173554.1 VOC family protein [Nesterenkonia sp. CL21]